MTFLLIFLALAWIPAPCAAGSAAATEDELIRERERMVRGIAERGIRDERVLSALHNVPRHAFVPSDLIPFAYQNRPLAIGKGQTISQPDVVATMTEALGLAPSDRVLEIGTGSGYQAAVLAELVQEVYTVEIIPALGERAAERLKRLGYDNVRVRIGDGYHGWPEEAPFDAIMVTAAAPRVPRPLVEQLKEGGRMVLPLGERGQLLTLLTKKAGAVEIRELFPVVFVPMTGKVRK